MHRPIYHNDQPYMAKAEICKECSHDDVLVPVSFCPEAMRYLEADERLDDLIAAWHAGAEPMKQLHEYLGWTILEYTYWVVTSELPQHFIDERFKD